VDTVAPVLNISIESAHGIIHETLKYHYLCSRWVLRQLTHAEHKLKRTQCCRAFLTCYHAEGEEFLACTVMGDKIWIHYYESESK
jgi:hypothetical protein